MRARQYLMDHVLQYQITAPMWLRYHGHLDEFVYGIYVIVPFLVHFGGISDSFGTSNPNTRPNSRDMPPGRTKKALLSLDIDLGSREAQFVLFVCLVTFLIWR